MGSLRVNPDITAAKQKFAELSVLLSALEEKAAGIEVDPEDGRAVENYAKLRSGIQQQRANLESIGSQLGQRETFAKYEQDMAAWRQARAGRSAGRKLTAPSSWPWIDHLVSGLHPATERPIRTRFLYGYPIRLTLPLNVSR